MYKKKILMLLFALSLVAAPAYADFSALERGSTAGRIIHSVSDKAYLAGNGLAITEAAIANLSESDYGKTGLVADGNTRLILRYQSDEAGTVEFSVSPSISGSKLERLTDRSEITAPIPTTAISDINQASAVFIAPETWPETLTYPKGDFTVTATFTPSDGGTATTETLKLTLQAPPVVLIHGAFGTNERAFGYTQGTRHGVWQKLEDAGLTVAGWNYANEKSPKELITNNNNGLAKILAETFDGLNSKGIAATRADLVTHSSGGLIARQYLRNDIDTGNKTANSYGLGTVRRVVTIASPNLGSNISSYCAGNFDTLPESWQKWSAKSTWEGLIYTALKAFVLSRKNSDELMEDTSLESSYIANLGYPDVPFHSIYGKVSADQDKFNQLFEDVMNKNIANLQKSTWLPEHILNLIITADLDIVSGVLKSLEPHLKFRELLGALFGNDDHDLIVSETSAKDIFPSTAVTAFEGMGTHNHILIAQQDDVGDKVVSLLKGSRDNFMINTASSSEYDSAFDALISEYRPSRITAADDTDLSQYIDRTLDFDMSEPKTEYLGGSNGDDYPVVQSVQLKGASDSAFSNNIMFRVTNENGEAKFFIVNASGDNSFDVTVWANRDDKGLLDISYMTIQDDKVKISPLKTVAFAPIIEDITTGISFAGNGTIYCYAGD
ncbi:MAG: hypothetical protein IJS42_04095, partial [Synergistaceae bacterium]|nr:hypothetical protein [Synergistaceae bacterium]